jgi:N-dimethylarginine dimethylaminohydrolase
MGLVSLAFVLDHGAMSMLSPRTDARPGESAPPRTVLMCPPTFFDVTYEINPWMSADKPVDSSVACAQWRDLVAVYGHLGLTVEMIDPEPDLPDMVFAANAAVVVDGRALVANFRHGERRGEEDAYAAWFQRRGLGSVDRARRHHEGQGDVLRAGEILLAGHGLRTSRRAHKEIAEWSGREVVSLRLVDPRYYHLDTALFPLGHTVAYRPEAFDEVSRRRLERRFPDAILADAADAAVLGLNAVVVGETVVLSAGTRRLAPALRARGFTTIDVDLSELLKAGGSVKCCTLDLDGVTP